MSLVEGTQHFYERIERLDSRLNSYLALCPEQALADARAADDAVARGWAQAMGTQLESRPRYTPTTCFEPFPFPEPEDTQRAAIADAAVRLNELRESWLNPKGATESQLKNRTLTNLYNQRPAWLANAHATLDAAVAAAYGWPASLPDAEILERLLALNLERSE